MKLTKTLALIAVITSLSVSAYAQRGQGGGGRGQGGGMRMMGGQGGGQSSVFLLMRNDVRDDLKISDEQKDKLSALQDEMRESMRNRMQNGGGQRPSREEMQKQMAEMQKEMETKVAAILTADQVKRLKEVSIQMAGSSAVMRPDISKEIALTEDQRTKITELQGTAQRANRSVFQDQSLSQDDKMAKVRKNADALNTEIDKILTADQRTKLKAMSGAPFTRKDEN